MAIGWAWNENLQAMEYYTVKSTVSSEYLSSISEEEAIRIVGPECVQIFKARPSRITNDWPKGEPEEVRRGYDSTRREGGESKLRTDPGHDGGDDSDDHDSWHGQGC